jgi:hypothetical protein
MRVDAKPGYVDGEGLNINVVYSGVVKLIENQNLQEHVGGLRIVGELGTELPKRFFDQLILLVECFTFLSYEFDRRGRQQ